MQPGAAGHRLLQVRRHLLQQLCLALTGQHARHDTGPAQRALLQRSCLPASARGSRCMALCCTRGCLLVVVQQRR